MTTSAAISVHDLTFDYGDKRAVDGVSFDVAPGEILGFLGPNGAGKSTTIKMLTGQLPPTSGSVEILNMPMPARRTSIQSRIGVCFEEKNLYLSMSARANLRFFAKLFGISHFDPDPLLERVGLADRADDQVSDYSKGMRQRLMMARTLVNSPNVLFLDEPTDGLDPLSAKMIRQLILDEAGRGCAVLLTTHDMNEADQLSDRVAFINEGKVLTIEAPETLKLRHGERTMLVRSVTPDGEVVERRVQLDTPDVEGQMTDAVGGREVVTIHTEEATLESIFIHYAGRGLE